MHIYITYFVYISVNVIFKDFILIYAYDDSHKISNLIIGEVWGYMKKWLI